MLLFHDWSEAVVPLLALITDGLQSWFLPTGPFAIYYVKRPNFIIVRKIPAVWEPQHADALFYSLARVGHAQRFPTHSTALLADASQRCAVTTALFTIIRRQSNLSTLHDEENQTDAKECWNRSRNVRFSMKPRARLKVWSRQCYKRSKQRKEGVLCIW